MRILIFECLVHVFYMLVLCDQVSETQKYSVYSDIK